MSKTLGDFKLNVNSGSFTDAEIIVLLGENGTGSSPYYIQILFSLSNNYEIYRKNYPDSIDGWIFDTGRWIRRNSISQH
jgi:translation initiation factor RLI1